MLIDYQFFTTNRPPNELLPVIDLEADGAVARNARHTARFDGNLNLPDAVTLQMPAGKVLRGRPIALSISDASGQRVWLGEIKDCEGQLVGNPATRVIYRDAFSGIRADVLYTYGFNSFEQDIILRENPELPPNLDLNSAQLEV